MWNNGWYWFGIARTPHSHRYKLSLRQLVTVRGARILPPYATTVHVEKRPAGCQMVRARSSSTSAALASECSNTAAAPSPGAAAAAVSAAAAALRAMISSPAPDPPRRRAEISAPPPTQRSAQYLTYNRYCINKRM